MDQTRNIDSRPEAPRVAWLDLAKGLAIAWIFVLHFVEQFTTSPHFGNPRRNWAPLADRFSQLLPLDLPGFDGLVANLVRWVAFPGDQGVQIFIVASGVGLAWSALRESQPMPAREFYRKRLMRIVPLWITAHVMFVLLSIGMEPALRVTEWQTWASLAGLRMLRPVMYHFAPAWWFIGLLLQFYLVFPLLMQALRRWGPARFFWVVGGLSLLVRAAGLFEPSLVGWWSRGGFFVTRLPEFAFGMAFAVWLQRPAAHRWAAPATALGMAGAAAVLLGNLLSFSLSGLSVAFLLVGGGWIVLFHALAPAGNGLLGRGWRWLSDHSLSIFLVHHPLIIWFVPDDLESRPWYVMLGLLAGLAALTAALALVLEWASRPAQRAWVAWSGRHRPKLTKNHWRHAVAVGTTLVAALLLAEASVRALDPQEVLGWGERAALQPDERYGYKMVPSRTTRLRWNGYDYVAQASPIGFPAPDYPGPKPPGTLRILVTGDAYESAEGVDTAQSWPRQLEAALRARGVAVEILNLSITGWGPNQYAAVVEDFAPRFRPDIVLVGLFVNDFGDAEITNEQYQTLIGFARPLQDGVWSWVRLSHLAVYVRSELWPKAMDRLGLGRYARGFLYGHYGPLERSALPDLQRAAPRVAAQLKRVQAAADGVAAKTMVLQVPAPAQICPPDSVDYTPRGVRLDDAARFDADQPQRLTRLLCAGAGLNCIDLRPAFAGPVSRSACQRANLHWTPAGHAAVAAFVERLLPLPAVRPPG